MQAISYKTRTVYDYKREWYIVDAEGQTLGRLSSQIAHILRGKHKPSYTPNVDCGDNVIIINCEKVALTGKKMDQMVHTHYTGYTGGQRQVTARVVLQKHPERLLEHAIKGMLPKNKLGRAMYKKLYVYEGAEHPHAAQQPKSIKFDI
jgi:large subunit ribosomal protein L13